MPQPKRCFGFAKKLENNFDARRAASGETWRDAFKEMKRFCFLLFAIAAVDLEESRILQVQRIVEEEVGCLNRHVWEVLCDQTSGVDSPTPMETPEAKLRFLMEVPVEGGRFADFRRALLEATRRPYAVYLHRLLPVLSARPTSATAFLHERAANALTVGPPFVLTQGWRYVREPFVFGLKQTRLEPTALPEPFHSAQVHGASLRIETEAFSAWADRRWLQPFDWSQDVVLDLPALAAVSVAAYHDRIFSGTYFANS